MRQIDILKRQLAEEQTARKKAETIADNKSRALHRMNLDLAIQHEMIRIMAESDSLDEITPKILKIFCETLNLEEGALWKVDGMNKVLRCVDTWGVQRSNGQQLAHIISKNMTFLSGEGLPGRVWKDKKISWIADMSKDPCYARAKWAKAAGLHSAFALPIMYEDKVLGVLEFFMKHFYIFEDNMIQMIRDISQQIGIFIEREQAQKQVTTLSRLAGMSEVASSVLHNVGNALNTINTSIDMISSQLGASMISRLPLLIALLDEHKDDLESFYAQNEKGRHIPQFLQMLYEKLLGEAHIILHEINLIKTNVNHVKEIIDMQQSFGYAVEMVEEISLKELLEHALTLTRLYSSHGKINIRCHFFPVKKATLDRVKLLQIIINLVKNSMDALIAGSPEKKELSVTLEENDAEHFKITVSDNGVGITRENLTKIFSNGFTTKSAGHGFGLHSSALFAKEMEGTLAARSDGPGLGAGFELILPYHPLIQKNAGSQ